MKPPQRKASYGLNRKKSVKNWSSQGANKQGWIWGTHAVRAALQNPERHIEKCVVTQAALKRLEGFTDAFEVVDLPSLQDLLPAGAVHQGIAIKAKPLMPASLEGVLVDPKVRSLAVLDQIQDPHNLGAIIRTAAAFGFDGFVLQTRNAPNISGTVAKAAAGAVETLKEIRVVNIARALRQLDDAGWFSIGLTGSAQVKLSDVLQNMHQECLTIVVGAEGSGIRPNVQKACSTLAHIPIHAPIESLNASVAAGIAFHTVANMR